ncbi:YcaO-like family protein [Moraxella haemolytica]|uniref:YcaO-like family protein n=1 Tax=Moraxella TaxID=475 RepID=UPI00254315A4|nr:YcaO-like family protein [Moraxella sp. ZY171148]WII94914.1 YcaO-like family protein [Moraxella sp. ZY171148]
MTTLSNMYFVDSVARVRYGERFDDFYGHSGSYSLEIAKNKSYYEIIERILASEIFFGGSHLQRQFASHCFFTKKFLKNYPYKDVLIRTKYDVSASGLGLHSDKDMAIKHAILEVLERHVALLLWYHHDSILKIGSRNLGGGYFIHHYTSVLNIPFCMSVVFHERNDIFFCGTSMKTNLKNAIEASEIEALSLVANIIVKNNLHPKGNVKSTIDRIHTLVGSGAINRINHLQSKYLHNHLIDFFDKEFSLYDLLDLLNFHDVQVVHINEMSGYHCYRAIINQALSKNFVRVNPFYNKMTPDPFC